MDAWDVLEWIKNHIPGSSILIAILKKIGFLKDFDFENHVDSLLKELIDEGLATVEDMDYQLTDKGNKLLKRKLASQRYM